MEQNVTKRRLADLEQSTTVRKVPRIEPIDNGTFIEVDDKSCFHRLATPEDTDEVFETRIPSFTGPFAKEYPFDLDPFQKTAIACLEAGDSVLVSAHTSAGKTVVAQYACAMALRDNTRMIYTSPLKALSNQKYRELYDDFQDVGLLTGDTVINENASCLVVTTEVFRSMLYENNDILREIKSVVFDEVHYLRDKERGVVWEECIILMPPKIQLIFLSATVPNAFEFATWFATIHRCNCHVIYTENRPVPLQHYIYPVGADGIYLVIDEKGKFQEEIFQKAFGEITGDSISIQLKKRKDQKQSLDEASDIFKLMKMVLLRDYDPVIVFAFSKKSCEQLALQLARIEINNDEEKQMVDYILKNAIDGLSDQDKRLPQVQQMFPMLMRGVGVHHSGLLPIVKEVVELLFQEGLIKILFATETFSTGLNMPAKTVVFAGSKKFDSGRFRFLYPGEYIQMSGRAGRRGIDQKGIVIFIADKTIDVVQARDILKGDPLSLTSEFRLSYRMILDSLKMEAGDPENIIRKSYKQFLSKASVPTLRSQLAEVAEKIEECNKEGVDKRIGQLIEDLNEKNELQMVLHEKIVQPKNCLRFLNPGRLVTVFQEAKLQASKITNLESYRDASDSIWGLIVNFKKNEKGQNKETSFVVDVLVNCKKSQDGGYECLCYDDDFGSAHVVSLDLNQLSQMSTIRVKLPTDLKSVSGRLLALKCLREVIRRLELDKGKIPLLDPIKDMKITSENVKKYVKRLKNIQEKIECNTISKPADFENKIERYFDLQDLLNDKKSLEEELEGAEDMILKNELRHMERALVKMRFIDETGLIQEKGKIALNFRTADELLLTELIFNGLLKSLTASQIATLVSCFVLSDKTRPSNIKLSQKVEEVYGLVQKSALEVGKVLVECKALRNLQDYTSQFTSMAMEAVYIWSNGGSFMEVFKVADIYEGALVRIIRQVCRILSELEDAVRITGQEELRQTISNAQQLIKRDVIFAGSLYL